MLNKTNTKRLKTSLGEYTITELAEKLGIKPNTLSVRLYRGLTGEALLKGTSR